jgi:hypothetical protein
MRYLIGSLLVAAACGPSTATPPSAEHFQLEPVVTFSATSGDGELESVPLLTPRLGAGYHIVSTPWGAGERLPRVFDSAGRYVRTLGRQGDGPREFRAAELVYASADTAMIFDMGARRMNFIVPPDSFVRTVSWQHRPYTLLELRDGSFAISTGDFSPGPAMLHVARDGTLLQSFGDSVRSRTQEGRHRVFAAASDGGFWSARTTRRMELQKWRAPGDLEATIPLSASWFTPYEELQRPTATEPPSPGVIAIWEDSAGMVWIVGMVAGERWAEGLGSTRTLGDGRSYAPIEDPDTVFDTIVECWDPVTKTRRWSERLDRFYGLQIAPWMMAVTRETFSGFHIAEVVRVVPK